MKSHAQGGPLSPNLWRWVVLEGRGESGVRVILPGKEELTEAREWGDPCLVCQDGGGQCFLEVRATALRIALSGSLRSRVSW